MPSKAERMRAKAEGVVKPKEHVDAPPPAETATRKPVSTESRTAAAAAAAPSRTASASRPAAAAKAGATRTKPVKMTVDLAPVEHRRLKLWCATAAAELELAEVAASEVVRVLVARLEADPALAEAVRADLAANGGSRRGWA